jgi:pSer/pThr/pTyr-binding forkhead associated (FHA) protein
MAPNVPAAAKGSPAAPPVTQPKGHVLRIRRPSGAQEVVGLELEAVTIGRAETNTIVLPDACVSRHHARIDCTPERCVLHDCGSKNGTFVNGKRVQTHLLAEGDEILVGDTEMRFEPAQPEIRVDTQTTGLPLVEGDAAPSAARNENAGLEALARLTDLLGEAGGELKVLEQVALHLRSIVTCDRATIVLVEEGSGNPLMQFTHAALPPGRDEGPPDQVIRAGLTTERAVALNVPKASTVLDATLGVRSHVVLVPLQGEDRKLGLLALERLPSRPKFEDSDLRLATIAGAQIANFLRSVA